MAVETKGALKVHTEIPRSHLRRTCRAVLQVSSDVAHTKTDMTGILSRLFHPQGESLNQASCSLVARERFRHSRGDSGSRSIPHTLATLHKRQETVHSLPKQSTTSEMVCVHAPTPSTIGASIWWSVQTHVGSQTPWPRSTTPRSATAK